MIFNVTNKFIRSIRIKNLYFFHFCKDQSFQVRFPRLYIMYCTPIYSIYNEYGINVGYRCTRILLPFTTCHFPYNLVYINFFNNDNCYYYDGLFYMTILNESIMICRLFYDILEFMIRIWRVASIISKYQPIID